MDLFDSALCISGKLCGTKRPDLTTEFVCDRGKLVLRFISGDHFFNPSKGFHLVYTAFRDSKSEYCGDTIVFSSMLGSKIGFWRVKTKNRDRCIRVIIIF